MELGKEKMIQEYLKNTSTIVPIPQTVIESPSVVQNSCMILSRFVLSSHLSLIMMPWYNNHNRCESKTAFNTLKGGILSPLSCQPPLLISLISLTLIMMP